MKSLQPVASREPGSGPVLERSGRLGRVPAPIPSGQGICGWSAGVGMCYRHGKAAAAWSRLPISRGPGTQGARSPSISSRPAPTMCRFRWGGQRGHSPPPAPAGDPRSVAPKGRLAHDG